MKGRGVKGTQNHKQSVLLVKGECGSVEQSVLLQRGREITGKGLHEHLHEGKELHVLHGVFKEFQGEQDKFVRLKGKIVVQGGDVPV